MAKKRTSAADLSRVDDGRKRARRVQEPAGPSDAGQTASGIAAEAPPIAVDPPEADGGPGENRRDQMAEIARR